ncbi:MAG: hypothetical protein M3O34_03150, partial [Chloroflexota bacterium]|nr:hypothetical protein [Chloroflexota bacterium]
MMVNMAAPRTVMESRVLAEDNSRRATKIPTPSALQSPMAAAEQGDRALSLGMLLHDSLTADEERAVVDLLRDLIRARSVNPPGDEQAVADLLAARA